MAEAAGVDAVSVSAYANTSTGVAFTEAPLVQQKAGFLPWTAEIKAALQIPVIAVGRLEPEVADTAIGAGQCDFVAMARKLLADPDLPRKLVENRPEDIRPCIYCYACVSQIFINQRVKCAVNPLTGHEFETRLNPVAAPAHIVVVGGGRAGMEAARVAATRGHRVTLLERSGRLGGTLFFAGLAYAENGALLDHLVRQVKKLPIQVMLDTAATPGLIRELKADVVIVATGAERSAPAIPGAEQDHVWSGDELRRLMTDDRAEEIAKRKLSSAQRALMKAGSLAGATDSSDAIQNLSRLWMPLGKRVAIVGGGLVGLELAEFLVDRGRQVTVLEEGPSLGRELSIVRRWRVLDGLRQHGAELLTQATINEIGRKAISYTTQEGEARSLAVDSVVLAIGARPDDRLAKELETVKVPVISIGDGAAIGYIEGALASGFAAGNRV